MQIPTLIDNIEDNTLQKVLATVGSSNFTRPGLTQNVELNSFAPNPEP